MNWPRAGVWRVAFSKVLLPVLTKFSSRNDLPDGKAATRFVTRPGLVAACGGGMMAALMSATVADAAPATFDCVTEPSLTVKVGSPVAGIIADVDVGRGATVKRGQVIARLQSAVQQAAVAANKARAESRAEIEAKKAVLVQKTGVLKRKLGLAAQHVVSSQQVDDAEAEYNVAKQDVALARLNHQMAQIELAQSQAELAQRTIRSPIDGTVTQRLLGPGEFVGPQTDDTIVTIARISPLNVETYLPVRYYKLIKPGEIAIVRPKAPFSGARKAQVSVIDKVFDAASGTFGVRLKLANSDQAVPAGLRCRVVFNVPAEAVSPSGSAKNLAP